MPLAGIAKSNSKSLDSIPCLLVTLCPFFKKFDSKFLKSNKEIVFAILLFESKIVKPLLCKINFCFPIFSKSITDLVSNKLQSIILSKRTS